MTDNRFIGLTGLDDLHLSHLQPRSLSRPQQRLPGLPDLPEEVRRARVDRQGRQDHRHHPEEVRRAPAGPQEHRDLHSSHKSASTILLQTARITSTKGKL